VKESEEEEQCEGGASPEEAHYAALRAFGKPALMLEHTGAVWRWNTLDNLVRDGCPSQKAGGGVKSGPVCL
jgi:hypothetical protein